MRSFFRRLAACAALFCANPRAFLRGLADPDSPVRRLLLSLIHISEPTRPY